MNFEHALEVYGAMAVIEGAIAAVVFALVFLGLCVASVVQGRRDKKRWRDALAAFERTGTRRHEPKPAPPPRAVTWP